MMTDITGRPARAIDYASPKHRNGSPPAVAIPLPEAHQHDLEARLREHYGIAAERDELRKELAELKTKLAGAEAVVTMMESNVTASESRVVSYQLERDKAVADRAKYETLFIAVRVLLREFVPPAEALVAEPADDA
jgi:hypothetical protein